MLFDFFLFIVLWLELFCCLLLLCFFKVISFCELFKIIMFLLKERVCFGLFMVILGIRFGFIVGWLCFIFWVICVFVVDGCFYKLLFFVGDEFVVFVLICVVDGCFYELFEFFGGVLLRFVLFWFLFLFICEICGCFNGLFVFVMWIFLCVLFILRFSDCFWWL